MHTADDATPQELRSASLRLLLWLAALLLVGPAVRALPLGQTTRTGILAWLLVGLALYWMYAGLGYRALLLTQLALFSTSAALLGIKAAFVVLGVQGVDGLREVARGMLLVGGGCAGANLGIMLVASVFRRTRAENSS